MARISLAEWPALIERQIAEIKPAVQGALHEGAPVVAELARKKIGEYQPAIAGFGYSFPAWDDLASSTIADKERGGWPTPDPLLRSGELRESIHAEAAGFALRVQSGDPIAKWQEFGTSRIPPRPFIGAALIEGIPLVGKLIAKALGRILAGR